MSSPIREIDRALEQLINPEKRTPPRRPNSKLWYEYATPSAPAMTRAQALAVLTQGDRNRMLEIVVEQMMKQTAATGAAVALEHEGQVVCRASSGNAPDVGMPLRLEGTFTGRCIQSGEPQRCDDSEIDPRVNAEACRTLGTRSMLVIPVRSAGSIIGVVEVLSSSVNAFTETHTQTLRAVAQVIGEAFQQRERAEEEPASRNAFSSAATMAPETIPVAAALAQPPSAEPPFAEVAELRVEQESDEEIDGPLFQPHPVDADTQRLAARREANVTFSFESEEPRRFIRKEHALAYGAASLLAIVLVAGFGWMILHNRKPVSPPSIPASTASQVEQQNPSSTTLPVTEENMTVTPGGAVAAKPAATTKTKSAPKDDGEEVTVKDFRKKKPEAAPLQVQPSTNSEAPPQVTLAAAEPTPALLTPSATMPRIAQSNVMRSEPLYRVPPQYPQMARMGRIEGQIVLRATIDKVGHVTDIKLVKGNPVFYDASVHAVKQWRYRPAFLNGAPIENATEIVLNFTLPKQ